MVFNELSWVTMLMVQARDPRTTRRSFVLSIANRVSQWIPFKGSITREELKEWMTRHGRFLTRRQVAMMIDAVDINDDGEIDYAEFLVSSVDDPWTHFRDSLWFSNPNSV